MKSLSRKALTIEPSQTLALFARAKNMKAEGIDVVSFTAGEPDFPTPAIIKDAGIKAIQENFTKYTPNPGIPELRKAIAEKLKKENQVAVEPSQILVSNGAKHSVFNALQAICNKGDEAIIPAPFWVSYPEMVKLVDAKPVLVKTTFANQFKMTAAQLKKAITKKTKLLIINSPSNPTGAVYTPEELAEIGKVVASAGIYVIADEIYEKVIFDGIRHFSLGSIKEIRDQVITVNGCSKAYSMTGWRIGFMAAKREIIKAAEDYQGQVTSNANSIAQRAALAAFTNNLDADLNSMVSEFDRRRRYLLGQFREIEGIDFVYPRGAFYLFFHAKSYLNKAFDGKRMKSSDDLCEYLLLEHQVAMVPGTGFGDRNWIRLSYACSMEDLQKGVERLKKGLARLG
ncbi:MAG: pyridoxal phosphate-dependent aminotransferase [Ignavibacteriales bacterium]|nr:pyridoxal phosphate-dependent aminotransferase [Ignavibacteriales bacterium]